MSMHRPKSYYRHMTREKADEIRRLYFTGKGTQKQIAEKFGIRQHSVSRIISGQVWE